MEPPPRFRIRAYSAPVSFQTIEQLFFPGHVLPTHCSLVKTVRGPPGTTRLASSVFRLTNAQFVGRRTDSYLYNDNRVCDRLDSSFLPDSVRASLTCSNNLRAATSSCSTEDRKCSSPCIVPLTLRVGTSPPPGLTYFRIKELGHYILVPIPVRSRLCQA